MRWFISRRWACCWSDDWRIAATACFWNDASGLDSSAEENWRNSRSRDSLSSSADRGLDLVLDGRGGLGAEVAVQHAA